MLGRVVWLCAFIGGATGEKPTRQRYEPIAGASTPITRVRSPGSIDTRNLNVPKVFAGRVDFRRLRSTSCRLRFTTTHFHRRRPHAVPLAHLLERSGSRLARQRPGKCRTSIENTPRASSPAATTRVDTGSSRRRRRPPSACATESVRRPMVRSPRRESSSRATPRRRARSRRRHLARRANSRRAFRSHRGAPHPGNDGGSSGVTASAPAHDRIAALYRDESGRVRATLIRLLGDFDAAEEATQDALQPPVEKWPTGGWPENPRAWLVSTGRHRAIDRMRKEARLVERSPLVAASVLESRASGLRRRVRARGRGRSPAPDLHAAVTRRWRARRRSRSRCVRSVRSRPTRSRARFSFHPRRWRSGWCERPRRFATRGFPIAFRRRRSLPNGSTLCSP